jgi:orotidine-5'-phosphate decarboxylase
MSPSHQDTKSPGLIVALDVDTLPKAEKLVDCLYPTVKLFKIGSQLFTACGPEAVKMVAEKGGKVFLDLKFYDIPQTVYGSSLSASAICIKPISISTGIEERIKEAIQPAVFMMTVHIQGGKKMLEEAVRGATNKARGLKIERPRIVGVTVLTSDKQEEDTTNVVLERAKLAQESGLDGVVCSVQEAATVRKVCGKNFIIVTPGIRPKGAAKNDQKRTATPSEAIKAGADYIVVGRPILEACEPLKAAKEILKELS